MSERSLSPIAASLIVATYYRGGDYRENVWGANCDQILTLSLYFTGDLSQDECLARFAVRGHVQSLYDDSGLTDVISQRYQHLINLLREQATFIEGGGNFRLPADPTYTSCRLTPAGCEIASCLAGQFPAPPEFLYWANRRGPLLQHAE